MVGHKQMPVSHTVLSYNYNIIHQYGFMKCSYIFHGAAYVRKCVGSSQESARLHFGHFSDPN